MMYRTVTVVPRLVGGVIKVQPRIYGGNIVAVPELVTKVQHYHSDYEEYEGEYEFTPSAEEQIVQTAHKAVRENIIINPIPSNYGLISWDGSKLTVS